MGAFSAHADPTDSDAPASTNVKAAMSADSLRMRSYSLVSSRVEQATVQSGWVDQLVKSMTRRDTSKVSRISYID
ncbi:hypothetical protein GCM10011609_34760 [Lentzea pudingi]|uniref:Uncharacterized protein n=1 Tax=Lentzea pudingi TaxID=1789439 RepID=A0ABQ2I1B2_9PSEU|nr:hypothetical protein GCM10011609_34760 [Lentzea pudingi]